MITNTHRSLLVSLLLATLGFLSPLTTSAGEDFESPEVAVQEPSADLGRVIQGESASHTFVLENRGETARTITDVVSPSSAVKVRHDDTIPPDGSAEVTARLDSRHLIGEGSTELRVFLDGTDEPSLTLDLSYEVVVHLGALPGQARWIYVQGEPEGTISQTVYSLDGEPFEITGTEAPAPHITVTHRKATPEERVPQGSETQWVVEPTLESDAPVGPIEGFVTVHTTHPEQESIRIPVSGFVRPTILIDPASGDFGRLELSEPKQAIYRLRNFATEPIAVTEVDVELEGVDAELETIEEGRRYEIVLTFDPERMPAGCFSDMLVIETESEKVPILTVELSGELVPVEGNGSGDSQSD